MLSEIHFLLTYQCNFECDHCFLFSGPQARGTFTIQQVVNVLHQARKIPSIRVIYFEGGEPTLYFPLLLESVRLAAELGFEVGIVTNAYGALSREDARLWLEPLVEGGLSILSVSDDDFHSADQGISPAELARQVGEELGITAFPIHIDPPQLQDTIPDSKGAAIIGGGVRFRGRAVDTLTNGLPTRPWQELRECPYEDLLNPSRVHVDCYGNLHICQGISLGCIWEKSLAETMANYHPNKHPICGPLLKDGPAGLIEISGLKPQEKYVDECHACFSIRRKLLEQYPQQLTPRQVYG